MDNHRNDNTSPTSVPTDQDRLVTRAQRIDPHTAVCFSGYYGEDLPLGDDGEIQRVLSGALVWSDDNDCVPDWAIQGGMDTVRGRMGAPTGSCVGKEADLKGGRGDLPRS